MYPPPYVKVKSCGQFIERGLAELALTDAEKVAQQFMFKEVNKQFTPSVATRADHLTVVRDSVGNPLMYVVNFERGGFCIVSATKKSYPILAHSDEGFFDLESVDQSGVCIWLDQMVQGITHQDTLSEAERVSLTLAWAEYESRDFSSSSTRAFGDINDPRYKAFINRMDTHYDADSRNGQPLYYMKDRLPAEVYNHFSSIARSYGCPDEYAIVETVDNSYNVLVNPLLKTHWHQLWPYNQAVPNSTADTYPAGCVAIAMAQVMKYFEYPARYNWTAMDVSTHASLSDFIYEIGRSVNMNYTPTGSGSTITEAKIAFKRNFNYSTSYEFVGTRSFFIEITDRPIIIGGDVVDDVVGWFPMRGHVWVVDGSQVWSEGKKYYLEYQVSEKGQYVYKTNSMCNYTYNSKWTFGRNHVNWGWGDSYDGWYAGSPTQAASDMDNFRHNIEFLSVYPNR